ncbi:phytanoyl-CoA dioxygenase family protein [Candidatus Thioglobus sp.]|nr:phytanoyl-CoA dioxygenase family protein [Candidatus Thioglobus sp.]|tara:strand:- start:4693 stop:5484 length:792 start_codon:yes stop_codon:yes gene_type:complete
MEILINQSDVQSFKEDGVVLLKGVFSEWIDILVQGAKFHINNPSQRALTHHNKKYQGQFLEDFCNWRRIPEYSDFVFNSSLASIASNLMESESVQFFHDHFFYKDANSGVSTPWHQDIPYYCVSGDQTVSFWLPLESREKKFSLRSLAGSHLLKKEIRPTSWSNNESFYEDSKTFMDLPDSNDYEIKEWETEPGDVIAFNFKTIHEANANINNKISRTLSFRLVGEDVVFKNRPGRTSPSFPGINQNNGERLREDWFPTLLNI